MQSLADITITPVANGYLVCLPRMEENPLAQMMPMFKNLKKDMEADSLLSELQAKNIEPAPDENANKIVRDQHSFVFTRFKDVVNFLNEKYGNQ